jgi:hypothetical protein
LIGNASPIELTGNVAILTLTGSFTGTVATLTGSTTDPDVFGSLVVGMIDGNEGVVDLVGNASPATLG